MDDTVGAGGAGSPKALYSGLRKLDLPFQTQGSDMSGLDFILKNTRSDIKQRIATEGEDRRIEGEAFQWLRGQILSSWHS